MAYLFFFRYLIAIFNSKNYAKIFSRAYFSVKLKNYNSFYRMKITLLVTGKTDEHYLREGIDLYARRLVHYCDFNILEIPDLKKTRNISKEQRKILEGQNIVSKMGPGKEMYLFDERGSIYNSKEFAGFIEKRMVSGLKEMIFVIGGPYGFSNEVYQRAASRISLSRMTFSHQLARLLCAEQLYRAFSIIKGYPYHND